MSGIGTVRLERVPSGISGLDTILSGGFLKGGLYIIQGAPGTGKTTLANQICFHHTAAGSRALYTTLLAEYHARMLQHLGSMTFFDGSQIPDRLSYVSGLDVLRQNGLRGLLDLMRREITTRNVTILVIDGFRTAQHAASDDQALNELVHRLQGIAMATDCTMFLLNSLWESSKVTPEHTMVDGIVGSCSSPPSIWSVRRNA